MSYLGQDREVELRCRYHSVMSNRRSAALALSELEMKITLAPLGHALFHARQHHVRAVPSIKNTEAGAL